MASEVLSRRTDELFFSYNKIETYQGRNTRIGFFLKNENMRTNLSRSK